MALLLCFKLGLTSPVKPKTGLFHSNFTVRKSMPHHLNMSEDSLSGFMNKKLDERIYIVAKIINENIYLTPGAKHRTLGFFWGHFHLSVIMPNRDAVVGIEDNVSNTGQLAGLFSNIVLWS